MVVRRLPGNFGRGPVGREIVGTPFTPTALDFFRRRQKGFARSNVQTSGGPRMNELGRHPAASPGVSPRPVSRPAPGQSPGGRESQEASVMRLLLIEDHKPLVRALKQGLEEEGFAVDVATDGQEG